MEKGDSLTKIAIKTGVPLREILAINNINIKHVLKVGEILMLPCDKVLDWEIIKKVELKDTEGFLSRSFKIRGIKFLSPTGDTRKVAVVGNRIDIPLSKGEKIVSAAKGKVIYAEHSINSMGTLVLVKHSKNMYTVYAGNDIKWKIREGQYFQRGWIMGYALSDTVLRFEILKGTVPIKPEQIIREVK